MPLLPRAGGALVPALSLTLTALTALGTLILTAPTAHAQRAYTLSGIGGVNLVAFDLNRPSPGTATTIPLSGAVSSLDSIDFRVSNGLLYGYDKRTNSLVTVDTTTGVTTLAVTLNSSQARRSAVLGIDFDPTTDSLRLLDIDGLNLRINPTTGETVEESRLSYAPNDFNTKSPSVVDGAYTNNDTNAATGTRFYGIDTQTSTLVTTSDVNSGVFTTAGNFYAGRTVLGGFDIFTDATGVNTGYAILGPAVYRINLDTGFSSLLGGFRNDNYSGLAITPVGVSVAVAAPEPGTIALLLTAGVPVVGIMRRRKKS